MFALRTFNPKKFLFLKNLLPAKLFTDKEWSDLMVILTKNYALLQTPVVLSQEEQVQRAYRFNVWVDTFAHRVKEATLKLDKLLEEGDTLIGLGNSPQYLIEGIKELLKYKKKNVTIISLAYSGHPNGIDSKKAWSDMLTQQGLAHFKAYLHKVLLHSTEKHKRISILDSLSSGIGLEFFIRRLQEIYKEANMNCPEIKIIAINRIPAKFTDTALKDPSGETFPILSLEAFELSYDIKDIASVLRITPDFAAWRWHSWDIDFTQPVGEKAPQIIEAIKTAVKLTYSS
jgi:hypothetical protein